MESLIPAASQWRQALEGWNVRESPQVLEWQAQARNEGRMEGRMESKLDTLRRNLHEVLEVRLPAPVPADVAEQIANMTEPDMLERWFKVALRVANYDEFRRHLLA